MPTISSTDSDTKRDQVFASVIEKAATKSIPKLRRATKVRRVIPLLESGVLFDSKEEVKKKNSLAKLKVKK